MGYVASRLTGRVRLLTGMVRANRPGRALLGLSKLLVGAFGTAAFALTTNTIWQMGDALDGLRLTLIMLLSLVRLVGWLIIAHDLWEKRRRDTPRELARLFNLGTVLTLALAAGVSYLVLFAGTATARRAADRLSVLTRTCRPVGPTDYAMLAWIISLVGHGRRRHRLRPGGRGERARRRLRLPPDTHRVARRHRSERQPAERLVARGGAVTATATDGRIRPCEAESQAVGLADSRAHDARFDDPPNC